MGEYVFAKGDIVWFKMSRLPRWPCQVWRACLDNDPTAASIGVSCLFGSGVAASPLRGFAGLCRVDNGNCSSHCPNRPIAPGLLAGRPFALLQITDIEDEDGRERYDLVFFGDKTE